MHDSNLIIIPREITYHDNEYAELGTYLLLFEVWLNYGWLQIEDEAILPL